MGRPRRQIFSNRTYEICMRTRRGLPFMTTLYMQLILESILARVQRDSKVIIDHIIWMANHVHIIIQAKDAAACKNFYGEVQKQITEAMKRLLNLEHLNLWGSNTVSVVEIVGLDSVIERIAYLYANPARANLVDTIDAYPGMSSWNVFKTIPNTIDATHSQKCRWVRLPMISPLPALAVTPHQDRHIVESMRAKTKTFHTLTYHPNAWMAEFGITAPEAIAAINARIVARIREYEEEARQARLKKGWRVKGAARLAREPINLSYKPARDSERIFVFALDKKVRIAKIAEFIAFTKRCEECYARWREGDFTVKWPPGSFKPPQPNTANWFSDYPQAA